MTSEQRKQQRRQGARKDKVCRITIVSRRHVSSHLNLVIKVISLVSANIRLFLYVVSGANWTPSEDYLIYKFILRRMNDFLDVTICILKQLKNPWLVQLT